jgi:hypothetical protein
MSSLHRLGLREMSAALKGSAAFLGGWDGQNCDIS